MIEDLDPTIHTPKRLAAMAILANTAQASFRFLRDNLQVSDSDLSKHMSALQAAGYITISKDGRGRGATTSYAMTRDGEKAYARHRAALRALLDGPAGTDRWPTPHTN